MNSKRREVLRVTAVLSLMAATGLISEAQAAEWNKNAFDGKSVADVIKALGGSGTEKSTAITFTAPDIAENGAVVPVAVTSTIPDTEQIAILVEKNPNTLAADFVIPAGTEPFVSTRVKMGGSRFPNCNRRNTWQTRCAYAPPKTAAWLTSRF
jgi:sulfur-oxidizing protein SoxY